LCFAIPTAIVWLIGLLVAVTRWKEHPGVSRAVAIGMACLLGAAAFYLAAIRVLFASLSGASYEKLMIGLSIIGVVVALLRTAGWAATLTAALGWRNSPGTTARRPLWQCSIRHLLIATLGIAVLCGAARALINLLGVSSSIALLGLADELPTAVCWMIGGRLAWKRWNLHPEVSRRVTAAIVLSFAQLIAGIVVYLGVIHFGGPRERLMLPYLLFSVAAGPTTWALLLIAAFGWRRLDDPFRQEPAAAYHR
jgi:hypothetical protein